ncbi:hypothetical protein BDR03DRAFT_1094191 [Suillus americanus]|nr:hypothetical protein BDR03DRAFT_1094191 [Suillus americanus]
MPTVFKGSLSCQKILRFITEPDRQHECKLRCPQQASLVAIRTALTRLFENIPFDHQAVNVTISSDIEASDSLVPDLRISFQNMHTAACNIIIPSLAETAFSQNEDSGEYKLVNAIKANPALLLVVAAVICENTSYRSPKRNSDTAHALLQESERSETDFMAATGVLPALNAPVVVENHTWCSVSSIRFKMWVRGNDPIDIYTNDPDLVADGFLYPEDTMGPVLVMIRKGVDAIRERLVSLCKQIDPNVDVDALRDPTIIFRVRKEDIVTDIAGAMRETAYHRYSGWYEKASKARKRKASVAQLQGPNTRKKVVRSTTVRSVVAKRRKGT